MRRSESRPAACGQRPAQIYLLTFNEALDQLEKLNARRAKIVELRCFGDLSNEQIAYVTGLSQATVK
jgi:DNA-directed RNA polymerase specialized sigma24 family protein